MPPDHNTPQVGNAQALDALRAWLLTEDAHRRGQVPDEVLTYLQDHITALLGPHAVAIAGEYLARHPDRITHLARDRTQLIELLQVVEGRRRPGLETQWRAHPDSGESTGPTALLVMAEHGVDDPVWDRPEGRGGPVDLTALGVSDQLVRRLRAWNETYERNALEDRWESSGQEARWVGLGLSLAQRLQQELRDIDVRYFHGDDDRPLRTL